MRKIYLLPLVLLPAAFAWACSGDDTGTNDGGGSDATLDSPVKTDSSVKDSAATDGSQDSSMTDASDAGADVQVSISCFKPADCVDGGDPDAAYPPDAGEVCCATVVTSGTFPSCSLDSLSTACAAPSGCATDISFSSCTTDTLRACQFASECVETGYDKCCSFKLEAGTAHVCANTTIATALGGSCP